MPATGHYIADCSVCYRSNVGSSQRPRHVVVRHREGALAVGTKPTIPAIEPHIEIASSLRSSQ